MQPTARENRIERLYHYQEFNPTYLADILGKQRVHCSDPANLNDPWNCRPSFDERCVDDPARRMEFVTFLQSMLPAVNLEGMAIETVRRTLETDTTLLVALIKRFSAEFPMAIRERWAIYCLTPHPDSTLMWSHYARNHRGICLEFGTESSLFGAAWAVKYDSSYPTWHPNRLIESEGVNILLSKSDDWKYEDEYRIIGVKAPFLPPDSDVLIGIKEDSLDLPPTALKSVIAGCEADYDAISALVRMYAPDLPIKRAVRHSNYYRLQIAR
jgi:hypothetical protein